MEQFLRKSTLTFALATLFGGVILFVSGLNWMDPQIGTLVPVLKSPWLMFHVAVVVGAYGFFGISCLIGLTNLVMMIKKPSGIMQRAFLTVTKPMPVGKRCLEWKNQPLHRTNLDKAL